MNRQKFVLLKSGNVTRKAAYTAFCISPEAHTHQNHPMDLALFYEPLSYFNVGTPIGKDFAGLLRSQNYGKWVNE
jgi:hypothetical protein